MANYRKTIRIFLSAVLISLFLPPEAGFCFSGGTDSSRWDLSPYLISQLVDEYDNDYPWKRVESFKEDWETIYAKGLVSEVMVKIKSGALNLSIDEAEKEVAGSIKAGYYASKSGEASWHVPVTDAADKEPYKADIIEGAVLIMVHTGRDEDSQHGDVNMAVADSAKKLLESGVFDNIYEIESPRYPSYLKHSGRIILQKDDDWGIGGDLIREIEASGAKLRVQGASDYSFRDLKGNVFVLAGGGFEYCHFRAFSQLINEIKEGLRVSAGHTAEIVIPAKGVYYNRIEYDSGDSYLSSSRISVSADFSRYIACLDKSGIESYKVVISEEGGAERLVNEKKPDGGRTDVILRIKPGVKEALSGIMERKRGLKNISESARARLIEAVKKEFSDFRTEQERKKKAKPGFLAGFGEEELGIDEYGVDTHDILNRATRGTIGGTEGIKVRDIIRDKTRLESLSQRERELTVYPVRSWIDTFCELYREELARKGLTEPAREEMVRKVEARIISHPSTYSGRESIYIDRLYFDILSGSARADDLFLSLVKHECLHIESPGLSEKEVNARCPLDRVREAIRNRTVLIVQSGGDCAGLNTVAGTAAIELAGAGWRVVGVKTGFSGLASKDFEKFHIPIDGAFAGRIVTRPTTDLKSSREDPFKIISEIRKKEKTDKSAENILAKIQAIKDWRALTGEEAENLEDLYDLMGEGYRKDIDKFIRTMKNIEGYGGIIVTGGDDHCKVVMTLSQLRKEKKGSYIAIPKSVDADAMVQMIGFKTAAEHMRDRFWRAVVTGVRKKVFVGEIMGRKAGWLTLAASGRRRSEDETMESASLREKAVQLKDTVMVIIPEKTVSIRSIILRAKEILSKKGALNIAVSEGFTINSGDPLWEELVRKNPVIAAKIAGKKEKDIHGNIPLAGASEFVSAALVTEWDDPELRLGLSWSDLRHTIFGYIARGIKPSSYDYNMARRYAVKAAQLINKGETGRVAAYSDRMNPMEEDPAVLDVEDILTLNGAKLARNLFTLGESGTEVMREWLGAGEYPGGFRVYTDEYLTDSGVIIEKNGVVTGYAVNDVKVSRGETVSAFSEAVKALREDFISSSISAWAHARCSIFEVPENTDDGLLTMAVADKNPVDYGAWRAEDKASWEKLRETVMVLRAGDEIPFKRILKEAARLKRKYGTVNIAVSANYRFDMNDSLIRKLLEDISYMNAKFALTNPDYERDTFTVKDVSEFMRSALVKYCPEDFPGESHARCNELGDSYFVEAPSIEERSTYEKRVMESRGESTMDTVEAVGSLTREISSHMTLEPASYADMSDTVILMRSDIIESISGKNDFFLEEQYKLIKQKMRKHFSGDKSVEEFGSNNELMDRARELIMAEKRVIILDDAIINAGAVIKLEEDTGGKNGKNFCVIAAERAVSGDKNTMVFVNLYAMALMGEALLEENNGGLRLFCIAYELFTGEEVPDGLLRRFRSGETPVITVLPRMIKLTGELADQKDIKRLFAAAA
ncbi:MAG: 6-phosphofructokinase [Candidatus Omnitrophota bacterium]